MVVASPRLAAPVERAFVEVQQASEDAQQSRLAAAIVAFHQRDFTFMQAEVQRAEHGFVLAVKRERPGLKIGRAHV